MRTSHQVRDLHILLAFAKTVAWEKAAAVSRSQPVGSTISDLDMR